jgi:lysophosphatidate acyltransferase
MLYILLYALLFCLGLIMILSFLGRFFKGCRFYSRILSCYVLLLTCATYGVVASVALRFVGKVSIAQWATARAFKTLTCPLMGIEFKVEGEEWLETRPAIFVSNHQSYVMPGSASRSLPTLTDAQGARHRFPRAGMLYMSGN